MVFNGFDFFVRRDVAFVLPRLDPLKDLAQRPTNSAVFPQAHPFWKLVGFLQSGNVHIGIRDHRAPLFGRNYSVVTEHHHRPRPWVEIEQHRFGLLAVGDVFNTPNMRRRDAARDVKKIRWALDTWNYFRRQYWRSA